MSHPGTITPRPKKSRFAVAAPWTAFIPDEQWAIFQAGTDAIENRNAPYLLGGALALATYTGHWRNTKDIDVIVRPGHRELAVTALREAGFEDYFAREAYDRSWIFRGFRDGVIFDLIWELPNHRVTIDDAWFDRETRVVLRGRHYGVAPAEELARVKLYVMQRERCDWVDVLNILASTTDHIDWAWLVRRMGPDLSLLQAAVVIFNWMCPERARGLPEWVRRQFSLPEITPEHAAPTEELHARLFDSRPWFAPLLPLDQPLQR